MKDRLPFSSRQRSARSGRARREPVETQDQELRERVRVAEGLAALDLAGESRVRESLRERLAQALKERRARPVAPASRRPWVMRRPVLAAEIAVLVAVALLAVVAPRSLAALVEPVVRMIEMVRVGDHTEIVRPAPTTAAEVAATLEQFRQRLANGQSWSLNTPYGGFGGSVPPGESARVQRVSSLERLRSLTPMRLQVPTCLHRDEPVRFDHAYVAPGGWVLIFFGSGPNELLLSQFPVGEGEIRELRPSRESHDSRGRARPREPGAEDGGDVSRRADRRLGPGSRASGQRAGGPSPRARWRGSLFQPARSLRPCAGRRTT